MHDGMCMRAGADGGDNPLSVASVDGRQIERLYAQCASF
jgi:hypothetical protein